MNGYARGGNIGRQQRVVSDALILRLKQLRAAARLIVLKLKAALCVGGSLAQRLHPLRAGFYECERHAGLRLIRSAVSNRAVNGGPGRQGEQHEYREQKTAAKDAHAVMAFPHSPQKRIERENVAPQWGHLFVALAG